jgi:hypothetical protein
MSSYKKTYLERDFAAVPRLVFNPHVYDLLFFLYTLHYCQSLEVASLCCRNEPLCRGCCHLSSLDILNNTHFQS